MNGGPARPLAQENDTASDKMVMHPRRFVLTFATILRTDSYREEK
jgi:hypothetical protein